MFTNLFWFKLEYVIKLRKLAYQSAVKFEIKYPKNWKESQSARVDWCLNFTKRHKDISLRKPESTVLARAMGLNKPNVDTFFSNLGSLIDKYKIEPHNIFNVDETGVTTVQTPGKVLATTGVKQVGALSSYQRGTLVILCVAVNAIGNMLPSMFVFPRKRCLEMFCKYGPIGCVSVGCKSGWMQGEEF